jgi:murein DD-endopeptidase MepM/ murein hydrolase activator NlpD
MQLIKFLLYISACVCISASGLEAAAVQDSMLTSNTLHSIRRDTTFSPVSISVYERNWDKQQIFAYLGEPRMAITDAEIADMLKGIQYAIPCRGKIWRGFGKGHKGLDIDLNTGDDVIAAFDGKVRYASYNRGGFGNLVIVRHPNGLETWYAHLSKIKVKPDDIVSAGEVLGLGGSTGRSRSPHLHLELRYHDVALDIQRYVDFEKGTLASWIQEGIPPVDKMQYVVAGHDDFHSDEDAEHADHEDDIQQETKPAEQWHRIRQGDNLSRLANRYGTSVQRLCQMNQITPKTVLRIGRTLKVG